MIAELKLGGEYPPDPLHRKVKDLSNGIEADRVKLKRLIKQTVDFRSIKSAYATTKGFEVMHALKKGQIEL